MLYEVLVALWHDAGTDRDIAYSIWQLTGEHFSQEAAARYLRTLQACGYVDDDRHPLSPRYRINPDGSELLARLTRTVDTNEVYSS
jgi:DNA-binding IclR family transcriptional regulator